MKKFKPLLITSVVLAAFCLALSGCNQTNTSSGSSTPSSSASNTQNSKVKGSWYVDSCKINGQETDTSNLFNSYYVINEDGTFEISNNGTSVNSGTYTFDGTTLTLSYTNTKTVMTLQNGDQLLYKATTSEGDTEAIYKRT